MPEKIDLFILISKLTNANCEIIIDTDELNGKRLIIKTPTGQQHYILIRFLNLDEARYIKIPKSDFNYELRDPDSYRDWWVLLVLHMQDMQPFSY